MTAGRSISLALEARQAGIETVFQTLALADDLDVPSHPFLGRELFKFKLGPLSWLDRKTMRERTMDALAITAVNLSNVNNPIHNMSGGQRQCVHPRTGALAAELVILDEPTAALGVRETAQVENIIPGLKDRGIPMILIRQNCGRCSIWWTRLWFFAGDASSPPCGRAKPTAMTS